MPVSYRIGAPKATLALGFASVALVPLIHAGTGSLGGLFILLDPSAFVSFTAAAALSNERPVLRVGVETGK